MDTSNQRRRAVIVLEEVGAARAAEFWERLPGTEIALRLADGLTYVAQIERVDEPPGRR